MPKIADYGIVSDGKVTLGTVAPLDFVELPEFDLNSPYVDQRSILLFNMDLVDADDLSFNIEVNDTQVFSGTFNGGGFFSMHEVLPANLLKKKNNRIQFKAVSANAGAVNFADIVIFHQRDV